ncbi:MAG: ribosomal protein [Bacteriovoracaceae bacterium]|nr:ribosomal protein [Bacteriovoracaceae bacterium]
MAEARFLGWQKTPISQATFGGTTRGGRRNAKFSLKHSTGTVNEVESKYYILDASEAPVGRVATIAATILMGKHRTTFTPGSGSGDSVIIINASKTFFTSDKADKKVYYNHSMYMGGLKMKTAKQVLSETPEDVLWMAVQGMLPKNKLSRYQLAHLKIYKGSEHPHSAQKPIVISATKEPLKRLGV